MKTHDTIRLLRTDNASLIADTVLPGGPPDISQVSAVCTESSPATLQHLPLLTVEEQETYRYLQQTQGRLEQKHIQPTDVSEAYREVGLGPTPGKKRPK